MTNPLRFLPVLLLLLATSTFSFAQDTTRCLVIERVINGKTNAASGAIRLKVGDPVMVRTREDHHLQTGNITSISDSTVTLSSIHTVRISHITEIRWDPKDGRNKLRGAGVAVGGLASTLFAFYQFSHGTGSKLGLYIVAGTTLVALAIVGYLSYRGGKIVMKHKLRVNNKNYRLESVPMAKTPVSLKSVNHL